MSMNAFSQVDRGETMDEMWQGFAKLTRPGNPDSPQWNDMKAAFFAGGLCLFNWFMVQMDDTGDPDEVTDKDLDLVSKMNKELHDFFQMKGLN